MSGTHDGTCIIGLGGSRVARLRGTAEALAAEFGLAEDAVLSVHDQVPPARRSGYGSISGGPEDYDASAFLARLAQARSAPRAGGLEDPVRTVVAVLGPLSSLDAARAACDFLVFIDVEERLSLLRWAEVLMEEGAPGGVEALLRHGQIIAPRYEAWSKPALEAADLCLDDEDGPAALASKIAWFVRGRLESRAGLTDGAGPAGAGSPPAYGAGLPSGERRSPRAAAQAGHIDSDHPLRRDGDAEARLARLRDLEHRLSKARGPGRAGFAWREFLAARVYPAAKRGLDFTAVCLVLFVAWPVYALVAFLIWSSDPGPVIYVQKRVGRHGRLFPFPKFRSMVLDADRLKDKLLSKNEMAGGVIFKMKRDPRIIPVGFVLRKYSLDELPQLWSILRGDLTLVGPRPPVPREVALYSSSDRRRLEATPGLTCIWQVSGRSDIPFPRQVELDVEYLEQRSLLLDLKILAATVPAVVTARGAY